MRRTTGGGKWTTRDGQKDRVCKRIDKGDVHKMKVAKEGLLEVKSMRKKDYVKTEEVNKRGMTIQWL